MVRPRDDDAVHETHRGVNDDARERRQDRTKPFSSILRSHDSDSLVCVEDDEKVAARGRVMAVGALMTKVAEVERATTANDVDFGLAGDVGLKDCGQVLEMSPVDGKLADPYRSSVEGELMLTRESADI